MDALTTVGLNLTLQVGRSSERSRVTSTPAQLNTSDARLGTTIRNELYTELAAGDGHRSRRFWHWSGPQKSRRLHFLIARSLGG